MIDAFKIGVQISMSGNAGQMLDVLAKKVLGLEASVVKATSAFKTLRGLMAAGIMGAGAIEIGKGVWDAVDASKELRRQRELLATTDSQLSVAQLDKAEAAAKAIALQVPGTLIQDNLAAIREELSVLGHSQFNNALTLLPDVLNAKRSLEMGGSHVDEGTVQTLFKILEMRGHISKDDKVDPVAVRTELSDLTSAIRASQGMLSANDWLKFVQQAGPAATMMDPKAFYGQVGGAMVAMGSSKAGTAMMSLYQQMVGHVIAGKRIAEAMDRAHLLNPHSWKVERGGKVVMDQNALVGQDQFAKDPLGWVHDVLRPRLEALAKAGKGDEATTLLQNIFQLSSRSTSARLLNDIVNNWAQFANEKQRFNSALSSKDTVDEFTKHDLGSALDRLSASWKNFQTVLGEPGTDLAIKIINGVANALDWMAKKMTEHPTVAKDLLEFGAGLSAVLAASAGITLLVTIIRPFVWLVQGIAALGEALAIVTSAAFIGGIAAFTIVVAGLVAALKLGSDYETPETRKFRELNRKNQSVTPPSGLQPQDGFDAEGRPIPQKQSFMAPPVNQRPTEIRNVIYLDGRQVAQSVNKANGDALDRRPLTGPTGFDMRQGNYI